MASSRSSSSTTVLDVPTSPFFLVKATIVIHTGIMMRTTTMAKKAALAAKRSSKYIKFVLVNVWITTTDHMVLPLLFTSNNTAMLPRKE